MRNWLPAQGYRSYKRIRKTGMFHASPPVVLAGGFLVLIAVGAALLLLPIAAHKPISVFAAIFTATSAVTVTGLNVLDTAATFTTFGQVVLAALIQIGGLGFVTLAVVAALTLGRKIGLKQQMLVLEAFNQTSLARIRRTAFAILKISASIELVGMVILTLWWWRTSSFGSALFKAFFHTVSAFNNAGFSLQSDNLVGFVSDPVVILTMSALIILGGIGFTVLSDVGNQRRWSRLRPATKIVLLGTLALNLVGFALIWILEANNPGTLGPLSTQGQALAAWFQNVTTRTAGFNSVDIDKLREPTMLVMTLWMFIGGGSLSTASGIKVGTFVVLMAATWSYVFRRGDVVLFKRTIPPDLVHKALALLLVTITLIFGAVFLISIFDKAPLGDIVFEVVSAISTVGLTRDLTPHLSTVSQTVLIVLMYVGRLGPLTLMYSLATRSPRRVRYPDTELQIG
jgi:trk system potassium uptake protein TrkH